VDSFESSEKLAVRGALYLVCCRAIHQDGKTIFVDFGDFSFSLLFPAEYSLTNNLAQNLRSWSGCQRLSEDENRFHTIIFSGTTGNPSQYKISLKIIEVEPNS